MGHLPCPSYFRPSPIFEFAPGTPFLTRAKILDYPATFRGPGIGPIGEIKVCELQVCLGTPMLGLMPGEAGGGEGFGPP